MNKYLSSASLKSLAKGQLLGKYGTVVAAYTLHLACILFIDFSAALFVDTTTIIGTVIYYIIAVLSGLLGGVFLYGESCIYMKIACNQQVTVQDLFFGFHNDTEKVVKIQFLFTIVSLICNLPSLLLSKVLTNPDDRSLLLLYMGLLLIANIINIYFSLAFSQCYYLMLDFSEYTPGEILSASHKLMKSNKGRLLYIELSFLPLFLLGILSCCIAFLWVLPYYQAVKANFYLDLIKKCQPATTTSNN